MAALFLISVLALYLELLLIRWIGTEINIFAYLQNTVLVVCFMGLGIGCLTCRQPIFLGNTLKSLLFLVLLLSIPITRISLGKISFLLSALGDLAVWNIVFESNPLKLTFYVLLGLATTFGLMFFITAVFIPIGRILGRLIDDHPRPITAYSVNIAGSLVGIWLFVLLSIYYQPPTVWFLAAALLLLFFVRTPGHGRWINLTLLMGIVVVPWWAARVADFREELWSPYQKLVVYERDSLVSPYSVSVNNTWFQNIMNFESGITESTSQEFWSDAEGLNLYDIPLLSHPDPQSVLVVGSGTGNDVASALKHPTVRKITAVEIDPAIIYLGRKYHPQKPYDSSNVEVINDDARSFFSTSRQRYDLIVFGFLDSHTMTSMTNARLDHYVYTRESFEKAKSLLKKDGVLVVKFSVERPFIADRLARLLREVFTVEPIVFRLSDSIYVPGPMSFIAGNLEAVRKQIETQDRLASLFAKFKENKPFYLTYESPMTTDDWPYLYLRSRQIPLLHYFLAVMILVLLLYTQRRFNFRGIVTEWKLSDWHFFFLGAAFLLLEVQNISKASVVLGNTWWVNGVIISGILVMILLANFLTAQFPNLPVRVAYIGLIGSCIGLYFVDLAQFGFLPYYEKAALVGALTALPVLFSGLIFIRSFAGVIGKDVALGANLIGSLVGGLLQSVTFITGIKTLLLIVAGLYFAALLCHPRRPGNL